MRTTTSKVPTLANWSRDTTIRLANTLFWLARLKPEEFEFIWTSVPHRLLKENQELEKMRSKLSSENCELFLEKCDLEEKLEALEEKLRQP